MTTHRSARRKFLKSSALLTVSIGIPRLEESNAADAPATPAAAQQTAPFTKPNISRLGDWDSYARDIEGRTDVIEAVTFTLSPDKVGPGYDLMILADTITISGAIILPSRNVTLFAREISFSSDSSINCSALPVDSIKPANPGGGPGDNGDNGVPGNAGRDGGNVALYASSISGIAAITSNGSDGGTGQQGGNGAKGKTGETGSAATRSSPPGAGGKGYQGGRGGTGGLGGPGGNAGQISIFTVNPAQQSPVARAVGGAGGQPGASGIRGDGGLPGLPGNPCFVSYHPCHPRSGCSGGAERACYPAAGDGGNGDPGAATPPQTAIAKSGASPSPVIQRVDVAQLAPWASLTQLRMTLLSVQVAFLNRSVTGLDDMCKWLMDLGSKPSAGAKLNALRNSWTAPISIPIPTSASAQSIYDSAKILQSRLRLGLDAFGYAPQYVSVLTFTYLNNETEAALDAAEKVESYYAYYSDANSNAADQASTLATASAELTTKITQLKSDAADLDKQADKMQAEITDLSNQLLSLQRDLSAASAAFQNAVLNNANGCNLFTMLKFVAGVISCAVGFYAGIAGVVSAMDEVNEDGTDGNFIDDVIYLQDTFTENDVMKNFQAMQQGYQQMQTAVKSYNAKLAVASEALDQQLAKFANLPEAQEYHQLLVNFANVAQGRNQKQLDYTQLRIRSSNETAQAEQLQADADRYKTIIAQLQNPALTDEVLFLEGYLYWSKERVLELLDLTRRGLDYVTLEPAPLSYNSEKVINLRNSYDALKKSLTDGLATQNGEMQTMPADFVLDLTAFPTLRKNLSQGGAIAFTIPRDYPDFNRGNTSFVTVTEIALDLSNVRSITNRFTADLIHHGNSTLINSDNTPLTFMHDSRQTNLAYNFDGSKWIEVASTSNNLRGSQDTFIYLSPFATWSLIIQPDTKIDWNQVDEITFKFKMQFVPRTPGMLQKSRNRNAEMRANLLKATQRNVN